MQIVVWWITYGFFNAIKSKEQSSKRALASGSAKKGALRNGTDKDRVTKDRSRARAQKARR